jgi:hypothetical protein
MTAIAVIRGTMTPHGRSPSSTPKSSMITARSELEGCFVYAVCGVLYVCVVYALCSIFCCGEPCMVMC